MTFAIVGVPFGLGIALVNYLHIKFVSCVKHDPLTLSWNLGLRKSYDTKVLWGFKYARY